MKKPIYLDYSATTPVDPRVAAKMIPYLTEHFGNPASRSHSFGWETEHAVEEARAEVAKLVNCDPKEIVWTSGATESINLALKGAAHFYKDKGKHLLTVRTEHKATLDTMRELERDGFEVTYLDVEPDGLVDLEKLKAALRPSSCSWRAARLTASRIVEPRAPVLGFKAMLSPQPASRLQNLRSRPERRSSRRCGPAIPTINSPRRAVPPRRRRN